MSHIKPFPPSIYASPERKIAHIVETVADIIRDLVALARGKTVAAESVIRKVIECIEKICNWAFKEDIPAWIKFALEHRERIIEGLSLLLGIVIPLVF